MWLRLSFIALVLLYCEGSDIKTTQAVNKCCPKQHRVCCFAKVEQSPKFKFCSNDTETWDPILSCIEKELYKINLFPGKVCCDLLYRDYCKEACHARFENAVLPVDKKLGLLEKCMLDYDYKKINCLTDSYRRLHFCYSECVALTVFKHQYDTSYNFSAHDHCSYFQDPSRDLCIGREIKK